MSSKTRFLLLSSAASMIVVSAPGNVARAADIPVVKANPVQYVETCSQYGYGWIRYPGTAFCFKLTTKLTAQLETATRKPILVLSQNNGGNTHWIQNFIEAGQQDAFGDQVTANIGINARTQTALGTLSSTVAVQPTQAVGIDIGPTSNTIWAGGPQGQKFDNYVYQANVGYEMGWLGNISVGKFSSEYQYWAAGDFETAAFTTGNRRMWHMYYQWNSSGSSNDPVGWTFQVSFEDPTYHTATVQFDQGKDKLVGLDGNPCPVGSGLVGNGFGACNGFGGVSATIGPNRMPDIIPNVRWLDDEIGSFFTAFAIHQIDEQATGPIGANGVGGPCAGAVGVVIAQCATIGQVVHGVGWGNLIALHLNLPKTPGNAPFARDYVFFEFVQGKGALQESGFLASQSTRTGQNPVTDGGLMIDDTDAVAIANPNGGFRLEKESAQSFDFQYRHFITPCTDPDWCWRVGVSSSLGWYEPGQTTKNTDWTKGGKGNAFGQRIEGEIHWGVAELNYEVALGVAWAHHTQDLGHDPGMAPTPLPVGINKDSSNWVFVMSFKRNFGGSVGKNLAGF